MHKFFIALQRWFRAPLPPPPCRELPVMSLRELADLPATHPPRDACNG